MTTKTRYCDECEHFTHYEMPGTVCNLGHTPRFYRAQEITLGGNWGGWKRRCEDFKESTREPDRHP